MKFARFACWILFPAAPLLAQSPAIPPINQKTNVAPRVSISPRVSGGHDRSSARQMRSIEQVLYTFTGGDDGGLPVASLIFDGSGNLYGASAGGGDQGCGGNGCGVVFELSPNSSGGWSETVLYRFTGGSDGGDPQSSLIFDSKGNLFGVTQLGGSSACTYSLGCGTVFELTPNGDGSWTRPICSQFFSE